MSNIDFKTRGDSDPNGKPRVWFCAHPADYKAFFESTVKMLHEKENCAVWYDTEPEASYDQETFFSDLSKMNLFVMPVTTKLLTTANRALDVEFQYAFEKHIPVLPIMQESGLEELFNRKCGDLQFLDPNNRDLTAISFDEKLKKYLSSVLIGDELAEKIRKAFDTYIFLSYRKKDRKYAQELMHLIHKNEFCRDIAIWYDEFLKPGENFNDSIAEAMKKSKLFALAVTPNLVNEQNYVMTVEYPEAKKADKKILPAELLPTDSEKLKKYYENIPDCITASDEKALADALKIAFDGIVLRQNENDPEHNFFIGLAYLNGLDVETNHERALILIESAADAELPEAMEKLVSMYRNGEGVKRDYEKAIDWQKKLVAYRKKRYEQTGKEKEASEYFNAIWSLGDYTWELRRIDETETVYREMLGIAEEINEKFQGNIQEIWTKRNLSVSYNKLGDIMKAQGKLAEAKEYYCKSHDINEILAGFLGREECFSNLSTTVTIRLDLSTSYSNLGDIAYVQGRLSEAELYYAQSIAIDETLVMETGKIECRNALSISYNKLGHIKQEQGKLEEAAECYRKSLLISETVAKETGKAAYHRDLAVTYKNLGNVATKQNRQKKAEKYYRKSFAIFEALAEETGTVESKRDLAISSDDFGEIAEAQGRIADAVKYYSKSLSIREVLLEETGTAESRRDISVSYSNLGDVMTLQGEHKEALEYYGKSLAIRNTLLEEICTREAILDLSVSYHKFGDIMELMGKFKEATKYYNLAIDKVINEEMESVEHRRYLSVLYNKLGKILEVQGILDEAAKYYSKSLTIDEDLVSEIGTAELRRALALSYNNLGKIAEKRNRFTEAMEYYVKSLPVLEALATEMNTVESHNDLAVVCSKMGIMDQKNRTFYWKKALNIWTQLAAQCPDNPAFAKRRDLVKKALGIQ